MSTILDINAEARSLVDADTTSYPATDLLRRINQAYEQVVGWLINADGTWQFDDSNFSTLPIGIYSLVEGQQSYSFASDFLDIEEVNILTTGGVYQKIIAIDHTQLGDISIDEFIGNTTSTTQKGFPSYYDKWEDSIKLYPAPTSTSCTLTNGLKVYFKRTASIFTSGEVSTGTKTPGFASSWHMILAYMAAIPYALTYKKDRVAWLKGEVEGMKKELIKHYSLRQKDVRPVMTNKQILYI